MPDLPPISEDFSADASKYVAAMDLMINKTKELVDQVEKLQGLITALDGKTINIDVGGNALEQIGIIENRLEALNGRTVEVNVIYKNLNGPEGATVTQPVIEKIIGSTEAPAGSVSAENAMAAAIQAVIDKMNAENLSAERSASILSKLGFAQQASAGAARNAAEAENAEATSLRNLQESLILTSAAFTELSDRAQFLRGAITQNEGYTRLLTDAYTALALRVAPNIGLMDIFAAKLAAAGGDAVAFRQSVAEGSPMLVAFATAAKAAGDNVGGILIPLTAASFGITGIATALHLIVMGTFEFLAVFLPAMYAAAAGAAVMMQGVQLASHEVSALYTATEALGPMFGKTAGDMLGLGHSLQTAQDLANPAVYTLLGEAILGIRASTDMVTPSMSAFGTLGLDVAHMLDQFGARLVVDIQDNMPTIRQLVGGAASDLRMFGQILGNVGHALFNFAAAMPGLAVILLHIVDGITALIKWVSALPAPLITAIMVIEEMYRWSGLLVGVFGLAGRAIGLLGTLGIPVFAKIATNFAAMAANVLMGIAAMITNFGALASKISGGEGAVAIDGWLARIAKGFAGVAGFLTTGWGTAFVVAAVAVGVLIFAMSRVTTATENFINASQKTVQAASNLQVLNVIAQQFQATGAAAVVAQQNVGKAADSMTMMSARSGETGIAMEQARQSVTQLSDAQRQLVQQGVNVVTGAGLISKTYGVDFTTALGMADMAGVKLATSMQKNGQLTAQAAIQIEALYLGYQKMDQTGTTLANSMNAVQIQAGIQASKVGQLNQAWDQFITLSTSLTGGFTQFNLDLQQMGNQAVVVGGRIRAFAGTTGQSVTQIAQDLTSFTGSSAQTWQSFNQSVSQANTFMDSLRIAATTGTVSQRQFGDAAKYVVAQLAPYAAQSQAALAEVMAIAQESGGPAYNATKSLAENYKTLTDWTDQSKNSSKDFATELTNLTIGISNVTTVARNFAGTLQSDVLNAVAAAGANTSKITQLTQAYTKSLQENGAQSPVTAQAQAALTTALKSYGLSATDIQQIEKVLSNSYDTNTTATGKNQNAAQKLASAVSGQLTPTFIAWAKNGLDFGTARANNLWSELTSKLGPTLGNTLANQVLSSQKTFETWASHSLGLSISQADALYREITGKLIPALNSVPKNVHTNINATASGNGGINASIKGLLGMSGNSGAQLLFGGAAGGGVIPGYEPGIDSVPMLLSKGEGVLVPQAVRALGGERGINALNKQARGMAAGGIVGNMTNPIKPEQFETTQSDTFMQNVERSFMQNVVRAFNAKVAAAQAAAAAGTPVAYSRVAGVTQWEGDVLRVLGMLGLPASDLPTIMAQILTESGGNPNAINLTDSNALAGDPSKGLLQTISSTFNAYRSSNLSSNIYDPLANIYAGVNYAIHRYGNPGFLNVLGHGHGYDNGGWLMPGLTMAYNGTGQPERVTPPGGDTGVIHNVLNIDGKTIYEATLPYAYQKSARNNGNARSGNYWTPGSR